MNERIPWIAFSITLIGVVLCVGIAGLLFVAAAYNQQYQGCIYPGVSVYGVDLGGLSVDEATAVLQSSLPAPTSLSLTLRDGERVWNHLWSDLGLHADPAATANLAYQVGREGSIGQQYAERAEALLTGAPLSPVVVLPEPAQAVQALEALAPQVAVPPTNAGLVFDGATPVPVAAQIGHQLDVEGTVAALPHALSAGQDGLVLDLLTDQVEPPIGNPGAAMGHAQTLLATPFVLTADDPLTGFQATWQVDPESVGAWLLAQPAEEGEPRLLLTAQEDAIHLYLEDLGSQLTADIAIDADETAQAIRMAIENQTNQALVDLIHPSHTYTVQPGDTLISVAFAHGFPVWQLLEANPTIEPGELRPGQEITIPSIDVLFPYPLITDRHILVDISDLRLTAYEADTLVYDFPCSTGIDSSPTLPGTFQILSKEENAYASSWDLWMPHFMGVYQSGPDFTNGIHGLPTLSSGAILWGGYLGNDRISYGCIVIGLEEAAMLYEWTELGTLIVIQE